MVNVRNNNFAVSSFLFYYDVIIVNLISNFNICVYVYVYIYINNNNYYYYQLSCPKSITPSVFFQYKPDFPVMKAFVLIWMI